MLLAVQGDKECGTRSKALDEHGGTVRGLARHLPLEFHIPPRARAHSVWLTRDRKFHMVSGVCKSPRYFAKGYTRTFLFVRGFVCLCVCIYSYIHTGANQSCRRLQFHEEQRRAASRKLTVTDHTDDNVISAAS